ncbi:MAG: tRNA (adenosine(37)-N6)-threonylcarbamoyltransferase complex transferase subunit TsaD [Anaerolineae bacterium]
MLVLGIESSCDETSAAIVRDGKEILSNIVYSQSDLHRPYGGVFPELACRRHIEILLDILKEAFQQAGVCKTDIDLIAATKGPGLIGALLIGLNSAKALSLAWNKPFIGVNHVEAHLYAAMMPLKDPPLPGLGVVISGGHTFLVQILKLGHYELIGATVDDAIGEAFDKVAAMLGLPYPGGPAIEALAKSGDPQKYPFKAGSVKGRPWDFSFSGLKTNVLYTLKGQNGDKTSALRLKESDLADVAASFQEAAISDIVSKSLKAAKEMNCAAVYLGGGVSNNETLRRRFKESGAVPIYAPAFDLSLDNAAMIAGLGYQQFLREGAAKGWDLEPMPRIPFAT